MTSKAIIHNEREITITTRSDAKGRIFLVDHILALLNTKGGEIKVSIIPGATPSIDEFIQGIENLLYFHDKDASFFPPAQTSQVFFHILEEKKFGVFVKKSNILHTKAFCYLSTDKAVIHLGGYQLQQVYLERNKNPVNFTPFTPDYSFKSIYTEGDELSISIFYECRHLQYKILAGNPLDAIGRELPRHISGFANANGGVFVYGINEDKKENKAFITGVETDEKIKHNLRESLNHRVNGMKPLPIVTLDFIPVKSTTSKEKNLIVFKISRSPIIVFRDEAIQNFIENNEILFKKIDVTKGLEQAFLH